VPAKSAGTLLAIVLAIVFVALGMMALIMFILFSSFNPFPPTSPLSPSDISATAEAQTFATAQAHRQETREAANAQETVLAIASATEQAHAEATALAYSFATRTAAVNATAEAPPTLTAQAKEFLEQEAHAQATVQALEPSAVQVYGPINGTLAHNTNNSPVCDDTGVQLRNFVLEARFYNPYPIEHDWDYGLVFTNPSDNSQYNVFLDADQRRSLMLQAPGYYVQIRDTSHLIDNSNTGSNDLKLYVVDGVAHLYINGRFDSTQDLSGLDFSNPAQDEPHDLRICTGLQEGDMQPGKATRYEDFKVWSLP
jgi:hypothetical protein